MSQPPQLFDPTRTSPTPCEIPGCHAVRFPPQDRTPSCAYDLHHETPNRPRGCLNAHQPDTAPWPEGL